MTEGREASARAKRAVRIPLAPDCSSCSRMRYCTSVQPVPKRQRSTPFTSFEKAAQYSVTICALE